MNTALAEKGRQSISRWVHGVWLMLSGPHCCNAARDLVLICDCFGTEAIQAQ
jgi:hypothetical protein